jgi:hypothetical protein
LELGGDFVVHGGLIVLFAEKFEHGRCDGRERKSGLEFYPELHRAVSVGTVGNLKDTGLDRLSGPSQISLLLAYIGG